MSDCRAQLVTFYFYYVWSLNILLRLVKLSFSLQKILSIRIWRKLNIFEYYAYLPILPILLNFER